MFNKDDLNNIGNQLSTALNKLETNLNKLKDELIGLNKNFDTKENIVNLIKMKKDLFKKIEDSFVLVDKDNPVKEELNKLEPDCKIPLSIEIKITDEKIILNTVLMDLDGCFEINKNDGYYKKIKDLLNG